MAKAPPSAKRRSIDEDTVIIASIVAESVLGRLQSYVHENRDEVVGRTHGLADPEASVTEFSGHLDRSFDRLVSGLVERANGVYGNDDRFANTMHSDGDKGRDTLQSFMQHWLVADLSKTDGGLYKPVVDALPDGYSIGAELPSWRPSPGR